MVPELWPRMLGTNVNRRLPGPFPGPRWFVVSGPLWKRPRPRPWPMSFSLSLLLLFVIRVRVLFGREPVGGVVEFFVAVVVVEVVMVQLRTGIVGPGRGPRMTVLSVRGGMVNERCLMIRVHEFWEGDKPFTRLRTSLAFRDKERKVYKLTAQKTRFRRCLLRWG